MHEHSHSNQRSKTHILARSPPTPLPPPLWPGPLVRFVLCTHIDSLWTGFRMLGRPASFWRSTWWRIRAILGAADRTAAVLYPLPLFFFFQDRDVQRSRPTPATASPCVRCHRPPAAYPPPPATLAAFTHALPHPRHWMCADVHAAIYMFADAAARSAVAVARLAQPRINFFGFYENSTKNQGDGTSGPVVQNLW